MKAPSRTSAWLNGMKWDPLEDAGKQCFPLRDYLIASESVEHVRRARSQTLTLIRIAHQLVHRRGQRFYVTIRHQNPVDTVAHYLSGTGSAIHCHRGQSAGHRFQ